MPLREVSLISSDHSGSFPPGHLGGRALLRGVAVQKAAAWPLVLWNAVANADTNSFPATAAFGSSIEQRVSAGDHRVGADPSAFHGEVATSSGVARAVDGAPRAWAAELVEIVCGMTARCIWATIWHDRTVRRRVARTDTGRSGGACGCSGTARGTGINSRLSDRFRSWSTRRGLARRAFGRRRPCGCLVRGVFGRRCGSSLRSNGGTATYS